MSEQADSRLVNVWDRLAAWQRTSSCAASLSSAISVIDEVQGVLEEIVFPERTRVDLTSICCDRQIDGQMTDESRIATLRARVREMLNEEIHLAEIASDRDGISGHCARVEILGEVLALFPPAENGETK